jgi:hypothetical protein
MVIRYHSSDRTKKPAFVYKCSQDKCLAKKGRRKVVRSGVGSAVDADTSNGNPTAGTTTSQVGNEQGNMASAETGVTGTVTKAVEAGSQKKKRDGREKMRRWKCKSNLRLVVDGDGGQLHITLKHHKAHAVYDWRTCSESYRQYIKANLHRTPVDIANDLRQQFRSGNNNMQGPPPDTQVVGYWWREYNHTRWEVDQGSSVNESVDRILAKVTGVVRLDMGPLSGEGLVDTIAWICEEMIAKLGSRNIVEVALDGTRMVFSHRFILRMF